MDVEADRRGKCVPRIPVLGELGWGYNCTQVIGRILSALVAAGALIFISWQYNYWKDEPTVRVDIILPSFFPVITGLIMDSYEVVSLLFLRRRRAINPLAIVVDVFTTGGGVVCFLILGFVNKGSGERRMVWARDMSNVMAYMVVFSLFHCAFIVFAVVGLMHTHRKVQRKEREAQIAMNRRTIVEFYQQRQQPATQATVG